ncbi:hypothetical protein J7E87_10745 [Streptomyces sp. ISL-1]|uniref:hypothetical protein n=1 Tax=Streptomyces sp. ISL-1 TaxID=2817657 RepID=UPI001BECCAF2|nr:hypothetical protein [Streptomyces sp. ISL-1]MBT2389889.1 hypothetical protein [Streptomyces sp. ISL-1]
MDKPATGFVGAANVPGCNEAEADLGGPAREREAKRGNRPAPSSDSSPVTWEVEWAGWTSGCAVSAVGTAAWMPYSASISMSLPVSAWR